ncbi:hypothetical protein Glove_220g39 [Diversispora epigaea]|uniref:Protein kinase domain-containing protein n=1 Tax=Diversispora epigaea TaxID=1348612 RepID=A0A397IPF5_9GLOM|nr:hypothetical protein Glove_220g39 [Diversispora epigaea]
MSEVCPECNEKFIGHWCKPCKLTHFKNDFDKWTSGNDIINKFIQGIQLNADWYNVIEWIPYNRFQDIKQIAKGGYGTIYHAKWVDGFIEDWDIENQQWKRRGEWEVVLKKFDGIDINEDFLNEMVIHLTASSFSFYGITNDTETHEYMMVLQYFRGGSLRSYLNNNFNKSDWENKLGHLKNLAYKLSEIHKLDIVHRDLHPGNILKFSWETDSIGISDFGLSKSITENSQKNTVSGVLPYIAPEVLIGGEYTKAADVYSFAFVAYEIITGLPPYHNVSHDNDLALKICNGFRPKIPIHTPKLITQIIMRCWDARITHRPNFEELYYKLGDYLDYYCHNENSEITIQIKEAENFSKNQTIDLTTTTTPMNYQTHPQAIYTSRLLNYSSLPEPKNEENFEKKLEKLTESFYKINDSDDDDDDFF